MNGERIAALLAEHGFQAAEIPMDKLVYTEESRAYCASNKCRSYGATWACPIASLMVERYLKGEISRPALEDRVMHTRLIK